MVFLSRTRTATEVPLCSLKTLTGLRVRSPVRGPMGTHGPAEECAGHAPGTVTAHRGPLAWGQHNRGAARLPASGQGPACPRPRGPGATASSPVDRPPRTGAPRLPGGLPAVVEAAERAGPLLAVVLHREVALKRPRGTRGRAGGASPCAGTLGLRPTPGHGPLCSRTLLPWPPGDQWGTLCHPRGAAATRDSPSGAEATSLACSGWTPGAARRPGACGRGKRVRASPPPLPPAAPRARPGQHEAEQTPASASGSCLAHGPRLLLHRAHRRAVLGPHALGLLRGRPTGGT